MIIKLIEGVGTGIEIEPEAVVLFQEDIAKLIIEISEQSFNFNAQMDELEAMQVKLDAYPEEDVAGMNQLYSVVQAHLSRASNIHISILRERAKWQRYSSRLKRMYKQKEVEMLSGDDKVKALKNKELQAAAVQQTMPEVVKLMSIVDGILIDLEALIDITKEKQESLMNVNVNLSRQQRNVESLIGLRYPVKPSKNFKQE
ncbi:MAG: hypothetical protein M0R17_01915 [Candidatus Omnitrophica bacterium]|jgi:hypothetical protein|nr:hypothetical protein [Candidatus Omnitrophota bacterium]